MPCSIPADRHISYQLQYRKCGKANCGTCTESRGHGPYWYAYWWSNGIQKCAYVGKRLPNAAQLSPVAGEKAGHVSHRGAV